MIVEKYGIQLKKITVEDIELIRTKRNSENISSKMIYRDYISEEQQQKWFESIDNFNNFYYLIFYNHQPIGLINDRNLDWKNLTSEAGLFIWDEKYLKSIVPALATLTLIELGFEVLSWNKTTIKILASNTEALAYNKQIGFKITEQNNDIVFMELNRHTYVEKTRNLIITLTKSYQNKTLKVKAHQSDIEFIDKVKELINKFKIDALIESVNDYTCFEYKITA
ncbi:MAG: GNAT family N-acetyltransferase [Vicingaceae bacterium]|nr:GNAT family N-acetyltransferase [Vicingaceae bacterium]